MAGETVVKSDRNEMVGPWELDQFATPKSRKKINPHTHQHGMIGTFNSVGAHGDPPRQTSRALRNSLRYRCGRNGRGVQRPRYPPRPHRRHQNSADHLADRAELRERFEREAKTIASLNHPHICTLYDIGHQDEIDFLVMEYLEGETLAQRLQKGPLPLEQVLQYAIEIADALDKAHRKGITHRDLKPGNIMLTKSGTKLLDFGLAKLKQEAAPAQFRFRSFRR